jgi:hypothetical protein
MCNLYSITTNQAAIINLFRVVNRYIGNLAPKGRQPRRPYIANNRMQIAPAAKVSVAATDSVCVQSDRVTE